MAATLFCPVSLFSVCHLYHFKSRLSTSWKHVILTLELLHGLPILFFGTLYRIPWHLDYKWSALFVFAQWTHLSGINWGCSLWMKLALLWWVRGKLEAVSRNYQLLFPFLGGICFMLIAYRRRARRLLKRVVTQFHHGEYNAWTPGPVLSAYHLWTWSNREKLGEWPQRVPARVAHVVPNKGDRGRGSGRLPGVLGIWHAPHLTASEL